MLQTVNDIFEGYRLPSAEEKQAISKYLNNIADSNSPGTGILAIVLIIIGIFLLVCMFAVNKYKFLYLIMGIVITITGIGIKKADIKAVNKTRSYGNMNFLVLDCICVEAKKWSNLELTQYSGEARVCTNNGQSSDTWFFIDYDTVSQNKAIGHQMLLVKFGNEGHLLFTDAMLGR